jgi:ADP-ribosylglycohydrolase
MRPHDGAAERIRQDRGNGTDDWRPSRERSIEELPIALGFLVVTGGDFEASVLAAANYGRDSDSIAAMAGAIAGVLQADGAIRPAWIERINTASRVNFDPLARDLAAQAARLQRRQFAEAQERDRVFRQFEAEQPA